MKKYLYTLINIFIVVNIVNSQAPGESWVDLGQQTTATKIYALENVGGGIALAGDNEGKILRSTDYGATWNSMGQQVESSIFSVSYLGNGVVIGGGYSESVFPAGRIIRSTDYGITWDSVACPYNQGIVYSTVSLGNGVALVGTYSGGMILRSDDYGVTWDSIGKPYDMGAQPQVRSFCNVGNGVALAGTYVTAVGYDAHIARSIDTGVIWDSIGDAFGLLAIMSIENVGSGIVLAGTANGGLMLRSIDSGTTWTSLGQQYSQSFIYSIASMGDGVVIAGTSRASGSGVILRSTDYGATWKNLEEQFSGTIIYAVEYLGNGIAIAGTSNGGKILRSISGQLQCDTFVDNFNRSSLGNNWDTYGFTSIHTVGDTALHCSTQLRSATDTTSGWSKDQTVSCDILNSGLVAARVQNYPSISGYYFGRNGATGVIAIRRISGTYLSSTVNIIGDIVSVPNVVTRFGIKCVDSTIVGLINGVPVDTVIDASYSGGRSGIRVGSEMGSPNDTSWFDNFVSYHDCEVVQSQCDTLTIGTVNDACIGVPLIIGEVINNCGTLLTY